MSSSENHSHFTGTPGVSGTGWFDRDGVERPLHGYLRKGQGQHTGRPYSNVQRPCTRCGGAGGSDKWKHTGWTCFDCSGRGLGSIYPARLYTAEELAGLNARRDAVRARKAEKRRNEAAAKELADAKAASDRRSVLAADPFYIEFQALMATFKTATAQDADWNPDDKRPWCPDFLAEMWKTIKLRDLSENQRAAVQKFIDSHTKKERQKAESVFIGEVGKRIQVRAKVIFAKVIHYSEGYWDPARNLIKLETVDGQFLTWFTGKFYERGTTLLGKATIKEHKEFDGRKETMITNFRVTDEVGPDEDRQLEAPLEAAKKPVKTRAKKVLDSADRNACSCGSGQHRRELSDARGIFCDYVCNKCEARVRAKYRPEIFTDGSYEVDEPIEAE